MKSEAAENFGPSECNWIFEMLRVSTSELGVPPSIDQLKEIAEFIYSSMSHSSRSFHRPAHLYDMADPKDPILTLAALFHDVVYFQVDEGVPSVAEPMLNPIVVPREGALALREDCFEAMPELALVCQLFGLMPGATLLPTKNLNEFLSATVAYRVLLPFLPDSILAQIVVCIEATIPFRIQNAISDPMETLELRLVGCNERFDLGLEESEIRIAIQRAVNLGNRDVQNFASENPALFLATTWELMPERNSSLRGAAYTFKDYRSSLEKMADFFNFLKAELVFKQYRGYPSEKVHHHDSAAADCNIAVARKYLKAKLTAIYLLEALAVSTGGDLPISEFLGPLPSENNESTRMETFLPLTCGSVSSHHVVLRLLDEGLFYSSNFDLQNSPLSAFIYRTVGEDGVDLLADAGKQFGRGELSCTGYLAKFPMYVLAQVIEACSKSCPERKIELRNVGALSELFKSVQEVRPVWSGS